LSHTGEIGDGQDGVQTQFKDLTFSLSHLRDDELSGVTLIIAVITKGEKEASGKLLGTVLCPLSEYISNTALPRVEHPIVNCTRQTDCTLGLELQVKSSSMPKLKAMMTAANLFAKSSENKSSTSLKTSTNQSAVNQESEPARDLKGC